MKNLRAKIAIFAAIMLTHSLANAEMVRIGTEGAYPPFNYIDENGDLVGFDVDIANALCESAQFECEFVIQDWDGIIPGLIAEKYDAIIASMSITEERKQVVDFTNRYSRSPARFLRKKGSGIVVTEDGAGMEGLRIGVQSSTNHENFVQDNYGHVAEIVSYGSQEDANLDMIAGRLDLLLANSISLSESLLKTDDGAEFEFVGPAFSDPRWYGEGAGIAVRKGQDELVKAFNEAIAEIRGNGTYQRINEKWFDVDVYGDE